MEPKALDLKIEYLKKRKQHLQARQALTPRMQHDVMVIERKLDALLTRADPCFWKEDQFWKAIKEGKIMILNHAP